jgi:hypothetical protein
LTLEFKTGTFVMPLIKETIGFAGVLYGQTWRPLREMFHATAQRHRYVRNASL